MTDPLSQVREALDRFDSTEALDLLSKAQAKDSAAYLACLIEAHGVAREFAAAEAAAVRAIERYPDEVAVHMAAGLAAMHAREFGLAQARYTRAAQVKPGYAPAYNNLGMVHEYLRREEEARAAYLQAIEFDPALAPPYRNLGRMAEMAGRVEEARGLYEQARTRVAASTEFDRLLAAVGRNYAAAGAETAGTNVHESLLAADLGAAALRHLPGGRKCAVLDLICGSGIAGDLLWQRSGPIIGVDPRIHLLHEAQARGIYYDLKNERPADYLRTCKRGETDVILSNCGFADQGDLLPAFLNIYAVLAPGGLLVAAFPTQIDALGYYIEGGGVFSHDPRYVQERADFEGMQLLERIDYSHETHSNLDRTYSLMVFVKPA
ncbi:MAG TPA: tetratricopeptide repeat protein [Burkholderiales bacterium]|jgi:Flp pilus assembly protein TadD